MSLSVEQAYIAGLNPKYSIKVTNLDGKPIPNNLLDLLHKTLSYTYKIYTDKKNGVIYIGKRV